MTIASVQNDDGTTTVITDAGPKKRRSAVEAAQARLEAAQKRERKHLLVRARRAIEDAHHLIVAAGDAQVRLVAGGGCENFDISGVLAESARSLRTELGE